MKFLGIDYGARRIGVAVSNAEGTIAFPRLTVENQRGALDTIKKLAVEEKVETVVMGDTRSYGGTENPITKQAEAFGVALSDALGVPLVKAFEVATSVEAARFAPKGKEHDDAAAAAVILQRYFDMKGRSGDHSPKYE